MKKQLVHGVGEVLQKAAELKVKRTSLPRPEVEYYEVSIIPSKTQYAIRIPKKAVATIEQRYHKKISDMVFEFKLIIPPNDTNEKPQLIGELKDGKENP